MPTDRLLIFAASPAASRLTTRLAPPLTRAEALEAHEACLRDVVAHAARERGRIEIWHAHDDPDPAWFARELAGVPIERQRNGDPGERLEDAFARSFADGAERVVIIGSDVPTLPEETLTGAFRDLDAADGVIVPDAHGGYVLAGLRRAAWPRAAVLFAEISWSDDDVVAETLRRSERAGMDLRVLPGWYRVERTDDLARAAGDSEPASHLGQWARGEGGRGLPGE